MRSTLLLVSVLSLVALGACDDRRGTRRDTGLLADAVALDDGGPGDAGIDAASPDAFVMIPIDAFVVPDAFDPIDAFVRGDAGRDAGSRDTGTDAPDARDAGDAGRDAGDAGDAGRDSGTDAGRDSGTDAGRDGGPDADAGPVLSASFPTSSATVCSFGSCTMLGAGGGGAYFRETDYLEETVSFSLASISELTLAIRMDDLTSGCAVGMPNTFDVAVNGVVVGSYGWTTGDVPSGPRDILETYSFAPVTAVGGSYTIRITATTTVCPGGSSWNWFSGGTASAR